MIMMKCNRMMATSSSSSSSWTNFNLLIIIITSCIQQIANAHRPCVSKDYGEGSIVCVCNANYCDEIGPIHKIQVGQYLVFTSSKDGKRFHKEQHPFSSKTLQEESEDSVYTVHHNETFQTLLGFGGAFTDAAGININKLSASTKHKLLRSYYSADGIEYNIGRVPIGGTAFSLRPYTYNDGHDGDFNLQFFHLSPEDLNAKIPLIKQVQRMSKKPLLLFGSAWSSPEWMKTNGQINGKSTLKGDPGGPYYTTWAKYLVRFLDEYAKFNITFWGLTTANEPLDGLIDNFTFNDLGFTAEMQRDFIAFSLGPTLEKYGYGDIKILILDDQRLMLPQWAQTVLSKDSNASNYVAGIAFHWYLNFAVPPTVLTATHEQFPDKFILATEACEGSQPWDEQKVILGSWERAEHYAQDIIQDLLHWTVGWVDWNLALDMGGGPNWSNNFVDSPIIVDYEYDQFFKQPMFYALGHFSKFLLPGSVRLNVTISDSDNDIEIVAFDGPERRTVFIVLNRSESPKTMIIRDSGIGVIRTEIPSQSIQTYVWFTY